MQSLKFTEDSTYSYHWALWAKKIQNIHNSVGFCMYSLLRNISN